MNRVRDELRAALPGAERLDLALFGGEDHDCPVFRTG